MHEETDEYGVWQVTEGGGYISRINIAPTQKYKDENPILVQPPNQLALMQKALDDLILGGM